MRMRKQPGILRAALLALAPAAVFADVAVETCRNAATSVWESLPTRRIEDLAGFQQASLPLTRYGGRADRREKATGFFRVQKVGNRWWFIDPEGGLFLHVGVVSVTPRARLGSRESFGRLFGSEDRWASATLDFLRAYRFNGIGGWSDTDTLRRSGKPLPYTMSLSLAARFGHRLGIAHQQPGHTGFTGDCIPSLHPGFAAYCDQACRELAGSRRDPWLLGYFSDNELPESLRSLDNALAFDEKDPSLGPIRRAAWDWLRLRPGGAASPPEVTDDLRAAFVGYVYDVYLRTTTAAIRRYDPQHLCLGPRFHGPVRERRAVWEAAGRYLDAIAMNYYGTWTPRASDLANWCAWSGRPCLITEFYTKGADTPFANTTGAGWIVRTQADRGLFYQNFTLALLESGTCVGWHWFKYMDNDPEDTSTDPSNRNSNKGIVTVRYEPYVPLLERMKALNGSVYPLADYFDRKRAAPGS